MALKILVCDDERHIVRLIQVNLERQGYQVVTAYDGKEGLEKIRAERDESIWKQSASSFARSICRMLA